MKEIKETKLVETTITKVTYQSDDGNYNSEDKEAVELYEAHRKIILEWLVVFIYQKILINTLFLV